jgi:hypothetical protein
MNPRLRDTWTSLQRAETLLFQAAALPKMPQYRVLLDELYRESNSLNLLIRMVNGFDPENLSAQDYLTRYPFSSVEAIRAGLELLTKSGHMIKNEAGNYAATELGKQLIRRWQRGVAELMQSVDLGDIPPIDVDKLLTYDLRILEALKTASRPHGNPILRNRLRGIHPAYDPPKLWHHWMHVWTMLAASEDEEEYVRKLRGIDPLVWFVRRQIWFIHRRPWRARARTFEALVRRATGYSPIEDARGALSEAIQILKAQNWLIESDGEYGLTNEGLAACDEDEREIDGYFLSCWPTLSEGEIEKLLDITERLNARFLEVSRQD